MIENQEVKFTHYTQNIFINLLQLTMIVLYRKIEMVAVAANNNFQCSVDNARSVEVLSSVSATLVISQS